MILGVYSVWEGGGFGKEDVNHPEDVEDKNPFQWEQGLQNGFGCKETCPGDEDGGEIENEFGEGGWGGRVGEYPDEEGDEEDHLFIGDRTGMNGVSEKTDESEEFNRRELVLPPFFYHPGEGEE